MPHQASCNQIFIKLKNTKTKCFTHLVLVNYNNISLALSHRAACSFCASQLYPSTYCNYHTFLSVMQSNQWFSNL